MSTQEPLRGQPHKKPQSHHLSKLFPDEQWARQQIISAALTVERIAIATYKASELNNHRASGQALWEQMGHKLSSHLKEHATLISPTAANSYKIPYQVAVANGRPIFPLCTHSEEGASGVYRINYSDSKSQFADGELAPPQAQQLVITDGELKAPEVVELSRPSLVALFVFAGTHVFQRAILGEAKINTNNTISFKGAVDIIERSDAPGEGIAENQVVDVSDGASTDYANRQVRVRDQEDRSGQENM